MGNLEGERWEPFQQPSPRRSTLVGGQIISAILFPEKKRKTKNQKGILVPGIVRLFGGENQEESGG